MWKLKLPMSCETLAALLIAPSNLCLLTIVKDGVEKLVRINSVQREDGSGKSFNLILTSESEPFETFKVYVRCS